MTDKTELIQQIEAALAAIKAGDDDALDQLLSYIKVGDIDDSIGIAIGQNIQQVIVIIEGERPDAAATLKEARKELVTRFKLPDVPPVETDDRVRRRGATPKLFISYAHADMRTVNAIARRLNEEFYYDVWIDYDSIPLGENWKEQIARGITAADRVLFMASPYSLSSEACREELRYAAERGKRIIPIRLTTALEWADLAEFGLNEHQGADFSGGDSDALWDKLLDNLPPVLARDRRRMQPRFRELHTDYLRSLFVRYGNVDLTTLLKDAPKNEVSLLDVYVSLNLGSTITIEVKDKQFSDWWVVNDPANNGMSEESAGGPVEEERPKHFPRLGQQPELPLLIEYIRERVNGYIANDALDSRPRWNRDEGPPEPDGTYEEWWILESEEAPAIAPHLVITGDPGSGKSTLVRHMALCMAGDWLAEMAETETEQRADLDLLGWWPHAAYTPVVIELRDLVGKVFPAHDDPRKPREAITLDLLLNYLRDYQLKESLTEYLDDLRGQMRDGDVMFFLDGLDEVPDASQSGRRAQVRAFVAMLRETFPACRILVTSRPYAYQYGWGLDELDFGHVAIAPLRPYRLEQLALKLFSVVLGKEGAEQEAPAFRKQVEKLPTELSRSPLMFTLMAAIWLNNNMKPVEERLPLGKGAIYRECLDMMFRRWTEKDLRGTSTLDVIGIQQEQLRTALEGVAYRVQQQASGDAAGQFDAGLLLNILRPMKIRGLDFDLLLDTLAQRAGVIYEADPGDEVEGRDPLFAFAHLSFREHLSACYLVDERRWPDLAAKHLVEEPNLWRNVFELLPDELALANRSPWELLKVLLSKDAPLPGDPEDPAWYRLYYAGRLLAGLREGGDERLELYEPRLRDALVKVIEAGALSPTDRAEMGRTLGELGDPRPGVGVKDGLPDIAWCEVPGVTGWTMVDRNGKEFGPYNIAPFRMAKYPVTMAQFAAFIEAGDAGWGNDRWWKGLAVGENDRAAPGEQRFKYANHPRENVSWWDAVAFCAWLSVTGSYSEYTLHEWVTEQKKDYKTYPGVRLPTEWEWQYAAQGSSPGAAQGESEREYPYEGDFDPAKGNTRETGIGQTSAVGLFPGGVVPDRGLLDMSGNVWEWCLNEYSEIDEVGISWSNNRVLRGGSCGSSVDYARASFRNSGLPDLRGVSPLGFRVVVGLPS